MRLSRPHGAHGGAKLLPGLLAGWVLLATAQVAVGGQAPEPSQAQGDAQAQDDDWGDLDDATDIEELDAGALEDDAPAVSPWVELVGYFHSAAVHLPIAWLLLMVLVDGAYLGFGKGDLALWGHRLLGLTALAFIPGITSGLMRFASLGLTGEEAAHAVFHRNIVFGAFAAVVVAWVIRQLNRSRLRGASLAFYLLAMTASVLLLVLAAHEGGEMVFGDPPSLSVAE